MHDPDGPDSGSGAAVADGQVAAAVAARPVPDHRLFHRELTPTWLAAAALLAGHRPPAAQETRRIAYLGSRAGVTAAVVAAVHPSTHVWYWSESLSGAETTRRIGEEARLANLEVHERPDLPVGLGGPSDIVVLDGVLDSVPQDLRGPVVESVSGAVRPGTLLCASYRTTVGWVEVEPVVRLLRHTVVHDDGDPVDALRRARALLHTLRQRGATYLTERPVVSAWLDDVIDATAHDVLQAYVDRLLVPISHAQVVDLVRATGSVYIGSADVTDALGCDLPPGTRRQIETTRSAVVREALRDLACRRAHRTDLFRVGAAQLDGRERGRGLAEVELAGLGSSRTPGPEMSLSSGPPVELPRLEAVSVGALPVEAGDRDGLVRRLLGSGLAHPTSPTSSDPEAVEASRRLNTVLRRLRCPTDRRVVAASLIGSAVRSSPPLGRTERSFLGAG